MADGKNNHGGARPGAGRKRAHDELEVRELSIQAIEEVYGSKKDGLIALVRSNEPSLMKFVFEHAFGKPTEKIEHSGEMGITWNEIKNYGANDQTDYSS